MSRKIINLKSGDKFGILEIVKSDSFDVYAGRKYEKFLCKCECGNTSVARKKDLLGGKTKSCGCGQAPKRKDVIGKKFNNLQILAFSHVDSAKNLYYDCLCDCGEEFKIPSNRIGVQISCGCISYDHLKKGFEDMSGSYWCHLKNGAIARGLDFDIEEQYVYNLYLQQQKKCKLSGLDIVFTRSKDYQDQTASLDRIDSTKGYIEGNVQWIHKDFNIAKQSESDKDFIKLCKNITDRN